MSSLDLADAVNRYSGRLHAAAGDGHHVVSPLGAWMVLALCGPLFEDDPAGREEMAHLLGADPVAAAALASALLRESHPLVAAGAGLWIRSEYDNRRAQAWRAALPEQVATGDIPSQEKLDQWADERTMGLIDRFPIDVTGDVFCLLATALATKVSWEVPFQVVDADRLDQWHWPQALTRVLETPPDPRHQQFITQPTPIGPLAVHLTSARGGLLVGSVIAADISAPAKRVLEEAERIVAAEARQTATTPRQSLFDLPLGDGPVWTVTEEPGAGRHPSERTERYTTILPAWSAHTKVDLTGEDLGFGSAAATIAKAWGLKTWFYEAAQSAMARYSAEGFEAAAISALHVALAAHRWPDATPRRATIRFTHPYAVVAVAYDDPRQASPSAWHGVPVFSAWVTRPEDAVPAA